MVDSIARGSIGRKGSIGRGGSDRTNFVQEKIQKMEQWRDQARLNILMQRERYKQRVETNQALMRSKKAGRLPNLNFNAISIGNKTKSLEYGVTHSTIPSKPKYSLVEPAERIFGNRWRKRDNGK